MIQSVSLKNRHSKKVTKYRLIVIILIIILKIAVFKYFILVFVQLLLYYY